MTDFMSAIAVKNIPSALQIIGFNTTPPAFTRLEPQSVSGDPSPGLEARIHDPLWSLCRQWQFGEFHGEDVGTPISVHVTSASARLTAWQPGDPTANKPARVLSGDAVLDSFVEREPTPAEGAGLRQRAEAGGQLLDDLSDAGITGVADAIVAAAPLALNGPADAFDTIGPQLALLLNGRVPDGEAAARDLEAAGGVAPAWLAGANDAGAALTAATAWLAWYRSAVAPLRDSTSDSWVDERLEYRFSARVDQPNAKITLRAPAFEGGRVDWYTFDNDPKSQPPVDTPNDAQQAADNQREDVLLATPLRFSGMPADRYWQFENAQVNLGMLETQPHDLARLCLTEFATIYGNDWLVVPVDVDAPALTTIRGVTYTNTFGEQLTVSPANDTGRPGRFRMFKVTASDGVSEIDGLLLPPTMTSVQEGRAIEDVLFLRDEAAAMAWAVERTVQGPSGDTRDRNSEPRPGPLQPGVGAGVDLDYYLETRVPDNWIPLVPTAVGVGVVALKKGAMLDPEGNTPVLARGVILRPTPLVIRDEEVPREGVRVRRVPALARNADGSYVRWIGRRVSVGRGEGSSGFGFDWAIPRTAGQ
jgi:hypothetical protein